MKKYNMEEIKLPIHIRKTLGLHTLGDYLSCRVLNPFIIGDQPLNINNITFEEFMEDNFPDVFENNIKTRRILYANRSRCIGYTQFLYYINYKIQTLQIQNLLNPVYYKVNRIYDF